MCDAADACVPGDEGGPGDEEEEELQEQEPVGERARMWVMFAFRIAVSHMYNHSKPNLRVRCLHAPLTMVRMSATVVSASRRCTGGDGGTGRGGTTQD